MSPHIFNVYSSIIKIKVMTELDIDIKNNIIKMLFSICEIHLNEGIG